MADGSLNPLLENGSPAAEHSPGTGSRPGTARSARPSASSVNRNGKGAGPVHFPDEADADGNPCMRGIDRCDEALGVGTAPNWQQVGAGRGSYDGLRLKPSSTLAKARATTTRRSCNR
eukprot:Skav203196  [mRNA]  locus=scaffold2115:79104:96635:+ [translate_table: standard]